MIAATPPTMMNSTPALLRTGRSGSRSTTEGLPPGQLHVLGKALEPHQVTQPLLDGQLEVLPEKGPIYILLIGLDDGIRLNEESWFIHGSNLPDSPATYAGLSAGGWAATFWNIPGVEAGILPVKAEAASAGRPL